MFQMEERRKLVMADASEEFRKMFRDMAEQEEGLELVGQTGDGGELLRMVEQCRPDVVIMDLMLA